MVLMCTECWTLYDDQNVSRGHYGVCVKCNKEAVEETPRILKKEFAKIFEGDPPSKHRVLRIIKATLDELRSIKPFGVEQEKRPPKSRRIFFDLSRHDKGFKKD